MRIYALVEIKGNRRSFYKDIYEFGIYQSKKYAVEEMRAAREISKHQGTKLKYEIKVFEIRP